MNETLERALAEKNVLNIRNALSALTFADRGFYTDEFDDALQKAESLSIEGLYEPFDGEEFKPEDEWDEEYWRYLNASLIDNFCAERIEMLKKVGRKVYPQQRKTTASPPNSHGAYRPMGVSGHGARGNYRHHSEGIPVIAKVGIAAAVVVAGCATVGPAATVGGIVVAGGAAYACHKLMK